MEQVDAPARTTGRVAEWQSDRSDPNSKVGTAGIEKSAGHTPVGSELNHFGNVHP